MPRSSQREEDLITGFDHSSPPDHANAYNGNETTDHPHDIPDAADIPDPAFTELIYINGDIM